MRDYAGGAKGRRGRSPAIAKGPSTGRIVAVGGVLIVLLGGLVFLFALSKKSYVPTDPETLCPTDRPPAAALAVLLDSSDALNETQRSQVGNELERQWRGVPKFGRIDVFAIDRVGQRTIQSVATICNPGTDKEISSLYQNPDFARRAWGQFRERLDAAVQQQILGSSSDRSPIFEAIQSVAIRDFNRPELDSVPKRLVVVSDLVQHQPGRLSFFEGIPPFEDFSRTDYFDDIRADLSGVDVVVIHLVRSRFDSTTLVRFWEDYFRRQQGQIVTVAPIYGER